jgi:mannonate dehydratase
MMYDNLQRLLEKGLVQEVSRPTGEDERRRYYRLTSVGKAVIVAAESDLAFIVDQTPETANGITFCTGSLGVRPDNDLVAMARRFAPRIHFAHLRSTKREADDPLSFFEAAHLDGDVDIVAVAKEVVLEERRRKAEGRTDSQIPVRSDHGQSILTDIGRKCVPGYPAIGRLRGLAELRGVFRTWERVL